MAEQIEQRTAQQIVDTVKEVCGYNINFIRPDGIITASTDPERVGTYHEIGQKAARTGETIEVAEDESFYGSRKGINMPFSYHGETVAVIGISGEPEEVRRFAFLAQRIIQLILRERELDTRNHDKLAQIGYVVRALCQGQELNRDFLVDFLETYGLSETAKYRAVSIRLDSRYHPANNGMIEQKILQCFHIADSQFYTFVYPAEYLQILEEEKWQKWSYAYRKLADSYGEILKVGVGSAQILERQNLSYEHAKLAVRAGLGSFALYDRLDIEILLGGISERLADGFLEKTIRALDEKEQHVLRVYFKHDMSLKEASEALFIHKNTMQYQLDKIAKKTGYNPRRFRDAAALYMGLKLGELQSPDPYHGGSSGIRRAGGIHTHPAPEKK